MDEAQLRSILDSVGAGVVVADAGGHLVYFNPEAIRLTGIGPVDVPADQWPETFGVRVPETDLPFPAEELPLTRALRGEATDDVRVFVRNRDVPKGRHLSVCGRPWRDANGKVVGGIVLFSDVGRQVRAEAEQRKAHRFLESIVEHVPTMIFVKEAKELRFERFNRAGEELLGLSRDVLLGKNDYDFFPEEQADFFTRRDRETLAGRQVVDIPEEPIDTAQGPRWLYTRKVPILDETGNPQYLLGISLDITGRREAEAALRQAHAELEQRVAERTAELQRANAELQQQIAERLKVEAALRRSEQQLRQAQKMEAIGRLAGGVAHDFNNMLTAILSYAQMLGAQVQPGSSMHHDLKQIEGAAERAAVLTRQLLAFSRQQVLQPVVLDLNRVVTGMRDLLRRLIGEDIELQTLSSPDLAPVLADPGQMEQVLLNLVVNARDAMPTGGRLTVETANVELTEAMVGAHFAMQPGSYVLLAVSDTGAGMSPETVARIFEPFFTTKARGKGTGLGLSTVFGIVKQSGGDITVYSEPGHGSTFKVYLPRAQAEAVPAPERTEATLPGGGDTVLLVEDEDLVRQAAEKILTLQGYKVLRAREPGEALLLCTAYAGPIHLLLTDVVMPGMNGRELASHVRELRPGIRVLFMSGYTDNAIVHHGVLDKGVHFLPKPFTPESLTRKIRDVLDGEAPVRP